MEIDPQDAFELNFYEAVARYNRKDVEALELLGSLYAKYNMARQALRIDRRLARLLPSDSRIQYNLACSLSLMGKKSDAVASLEEAIRLGYDDTEWMLQDPDLEALKGDPNYEALIQSLIEAD